MSALTRYEQTKQAFLQARSYATAWDFMEAAIEARGAPTEKSEQEWFYDQLLGWTIDKIIEADHEQRPEAA